MATKENELTLAEQDAQINRITAQIAKKKEMITQKMQEMRSSKKENPLLEGVYNEYVSYIKKTNEDTINALSTLHTYLSDLEVSEEDSSEREKDVKRIAAELKKYRKK